MGHVGISSQALGYVGRVVMVACTALVLAAGPAGARFALGLQDQALDGPPDTPASTQAWNVMRAINGSVSRIQVAWSATAPAGFTEPGGFDASNPQDPRYDWSATDAAVRTAAAHHVEPLLDLLNAPRWAEGASPPADPTISQGSWDPEATKFGQFVQAAARRYDGRFPDPLSRGNALPRVRLWEIWNEENMAWFLAAPNVVEEYRALLNSAYTALKSVDARNLVIAGGLAPASFSPRSVSPLKFAAELLCLRRIGSAFRPAGACAHRAHFDVFSHHPYTEAVTPTMHAYYYDDVLVADMAKIKALLSAADRYHTAAPYIRHPLWVTEWGWFTKPPNACGDPQRTAGRYVAYSMYELWRAGARVVIWQTVEDHAGPNPGPGLYTRTGKAKLTLRAFSFPVIAAAQGRWGFVWGRAPVPAATVVVQEAVGRRWRALARVRAGADGVFQLALRFRPSRAFRARVVRGPVSLAYNSAPIPPKRTHSHC